MFRRSYNNVVGVRCFIACCVRSFTSKKKKRLVITLNKRMNVSQGIKTVLLCRTLELHYCTNLL